MQCILYQWHQGPANVSVQGNTTIVWQSTLIGVNVVWRLCAMPKIMCGLPPPAEDGNATGFATLLPAQALLDAPYVHPNDTVPEQHVRSSASRLQDLLVGGEVGDIF